MNEMAQTEKMLSRKEAGVGYVIFNNPERHNAVSLEMWRRPGPHPDGLRQATTRCAASCSPGAGDKAFVSGADISKFEEERSNEEAIARYNQTSEKASHAIDAIRSPPSR